MSRPTKHCDEELAILERIHLIKHDFPQGKWKSDVPPEPDLYLDSDNSRIGLELTRLFKLGQDLKHKESEEEYILSEAKDCYARREQIPLNVRVYWSHRSKPKKIVRLLIAQHLCKIVIANVPAVGQRISIDACDEPMPDLPQGIDKIEIDRFFEYNFHFWNSPRAAFVPDLIPDDIQEILALKSKKYRNYDGPCSELWLLIVSEGLSPSSFGSPTKELITHEYQGCFNKLFFASLMPPQVIELNLANRA